MTGTGKSPSREDFLDGGDEVPSVVDASRHVFGVVARHVPDLSAIGQGDGNGDSSWGLSSSGTSRTLSPTFRYRSMMR